MPPISPRANPFPAFDALRVATAEDDDASRVMRLFSGRIAPVVATVRWSGEPLQVDLAQLGRLRRWRVVPNRIASFALRGPGVIVRIAHGEEGEESELPH
jgi:hypothetical protein